MSITSIEWLVVLIHAKSQPAEHANPPLQLTAIVDGTLHDEDADLAALEYQVVQWVRAKHLEAVDAATTVRGEWMLCSPPPTLCVCSRALSLL